MDRAGTKNVRGVFLCARRETGAFLNAPSQFGQIRSRTRFLRRLWIDYMFHDARLAPADLSDVSVPANPIPDLVHPSDHLPLACGFRWA